MDELKQIYERITLLRQKGIKMKEIAGQTGFSPSVLSALYSTVLPAFFQNQKKGMNNEEALDQALVWVNNISKKKLLGSLPSLKASLFAMQVIPKVPTRENDNPFLAELEANMRETLSWIANYSGIYISYSLSSTSQAMKVEPYLIAPAEKGNYVEVTTTSTEQLIMGLP